MVRQHGSTPVCSDPIYLCLHLGTSLWRVVTAVPATLRKLPGTGRYEGSLGDQRLVWNDIPVVRWYHDDVSGISFDELECAGEHTMRMPAPHQEEGGGLGSLRLLVAIFDLHLSTFQYTTPFLI
jgi:hypothetical protein